MGRSTFDRTADLQAQRPVLIKPKLIPTGRFDIFSPDKRVAASTLVSSLNQDGPHFDAFKTPTQDRTNSYADYSTSEVRDEIISE
jgi:hypothetical protein